MHAVDLRVRAVLRSQVVEFSRPLELPFPPFPWLFVRVGSLSLRLCELTWDIEQGHFICYADDDIDAAFTFGDDRAALVRHYEEDGWQVRHEGPVLRVLGLETLATPESA
jgi:hypothetical protein